jgi:Ni,Fe-hydrogenase I cytochrome b subunit
MLSVSSHMGLSSGVRVVHYLSFLCCVQLTCSPCCQWVHPWFSTRTPLLKCMGELTDNMENKLTKHNTENWNNIQQGSCCILFEFSVLCLVNLFSMLSVSSHIGLSSGVRVVHYLSFLCCVQLTCSPCCQWDHPWYLKPWVNWHWQHGEQVN